MYKKLSVRRTGSNGVWSDYTIREYNRLESNNTPVEWSRDLISWSPNGDLAFAIGDQTVKLQKSDGTLKTLKDFNASIVGVSWSNDNILAVASGSTVTLWNCDGDL